MPDTEPESQVPDGADRFDFFMDFGDHWCRPLADAFGLTNADVEARVSNKITEGWGFSYRGQYDKDPRRALRIYPPETTFVFNSDWPESEDLGFYLATHALCSVAGELVRTLPSYCETYDDGTEEDLFAEWHAKFTVSRRDGRWLADRRDPAPDSVFTGDDRGSEPDWIWRLTPAHFDDRVLNGDWVRVWEVSDESSYRATQTIAIRSALVASDKARALAQALQTASSYRDHRLPDAADEFDTYSVSGYVVNGWIIDDATGNGQDSRDPLAGPIGYPPPHPSAAFTEMLGITPDDDMRYWSDTEHVVARSTVWDDDHKLSEYRKPGRSGRRLEVRREALASMLAKCSRTLLIEVMMHRDSDDRRRPSSKPQISPDELPYLEKSYKIYLLDSAGSISAV